MFDLTEAKDIQHLVAKVAGRNILGMEDRSGDHRLQPVVRPALLPPRRFWRGFDLYRGLGLNTHIRNLSDLRETFAAFIETYLAEPTEGMEHPYKHLANELGLSRTEYRALFPIQRRTRRDMEIAYSLGILLWLGRQMGGQLFYGKDWFLVYGEGLEPFGVDHGQTVCHYEDYCLPCPTQDWEKFLESPRSESGKFPPELTRLLSDARFRDNPESEDMHYAYLCALWGAYDSLEILLADYYFPGATKPAFEYVRQEVYSASNPVKRLRELLVPNFINGAAYDRITSRHRIYQHLWESSKDVEKFITSIFDQIALPLIKTTTRKKNANSNHRKGRSG